MIQGPACFLTGLSTAEVAADERSWAFVGLFSTLGGFVGYLVYQVRSSHAQDAQKLKEAAVLQEMVRKGEVSLAGARAITNRRSG